MYGEIKKREKENVLTYSLQSKLDNFEEACKFNFLSYKENRKNRGLSNPL